MIKSCLDVYMEIIDIKFQIINNNNKNAEIRIFFNNKGSYSYVGKENLNIPYDFETMNLDLINDDGEENVKINRSIILHEFGHVLGMLHEHQHPESDINWNLSIIYNYYQKYFNWSKEMVDNNILYKYNNKDIIKNNYDEKSIMHYDFNSLITGKKYERNYLLSNSDIIFLKTIYKQDKNIKKIFSCWSIRIW